MAGLLRGDVVHLRAQDRLINAGVALLLDDSSYGICRWLQAALHR